MRKSKNRSLKYLAISKKSVHQFWCAMAFILRFFLGVKDTPVLMANNPFKNVVPAVALATMPLVAPIQDVKVDDMVKAYHHEDMYLTASSDDDIYVPGWQDYYYLDITPETWQVGKFIITEEDGSEIEIEANRPKDWFEKRQVKEIGDEAFLYMPDVNIIGDGKLIGFRATDIDTRILKRNATGQVDRPVISTFKRFSPIVYDYSFSDGGKIGATPEHPFYSVDRQTYIPIGELEEGELVKSSSDKEVRFIGGKLRDKGEPVYNFEVWREHNYYVGFEGSGDFVLVHNACFPDSKQLAKLLGISENAIHDLKKVMLKDWKNDFPPGFGTNPDIGIGDAGQLLFKSRLNGEIFDTGFDIINYID